MKNDTTVALRGRGKPRNSFIGHLFAFLRRFLALLLASRVGNLVEEGRRGSCIGLLQWWFCLHGMFWTFAMLGLSRDKETLSYVITLGLFLLSCNRLLGLWVSIGNHLRIRLKYIRALSLKRNLMFTFIEDAMGFKTVYHS